MTAAHGGYGSEKVPLGGGAAICERLCRVWAGDPEIDLHLFAPGPNPPEGVTYHRLELLEQPPSSLDELTYARFCRQFERGITDGILALEGVDAVFSHDISEGPDFARLAAAGVTCLPIFHVDVVDFFNRIYLKGIFPVERVARWAASMPLPDVLKLVFTKQQAAVRHCPALILPSAAMGEVMARCYPELGRTEVVGWGSPEPVFAQDQVDEAAHELRRELGLGPGQPFLVTLSRISPEKGQDRLLEALRLGRQRGELPPGLQLAICGQPAFMQGQRFFARLQKLAGDLPVLFPGHLGGLRKQAFLRAADLFVVASRHESYGLTTLEALQQGCPVVAVESYGTRATVEPSFGRLVPPGAELSLRLWCTVRDLLEREAEPLKAAARAYADRHTFARAAQRLKSLAGELA